MPEKINLSLDSITIVVVTAIIILAISALIFVGMRDTSSVTTGYVYDNRSTGNDITTLSNEYALLDPALQVEDATILLWNDTSGEILNSANYTLLENASGAYLNQSASAFVGQHRAVRVAAPPCPGFSFLL